MFLSGDRAAHGKKLRDSDILALVREAPEDPFWQSWNEKEALAAARRQLGALAGSFTLAAVLAAGLADGVNPCAFAVIVFLVSYLTLAGGMGKRYALTFGLLFCAGVFACYFLIGIGFFQLLDALQQIKSAARVLFFVMGIVCLAFAIGALVDVLNAKKYGASKMKFGMPKPLRNLVHRLIRENVGRGMLAVSAVGLGIAVSGLELVCTGQVYLPVIVFINSTAPGMQSLGLLLLYNLAFIVPLLIVVVLGVCGVGSKALSRWASRHAVVMRAVVGVVVLGLSAIMFTLALRGL